MIPSGPTVARLERPRGPTTRLAVVADPHLTDRAEGTWKVYHRTITRFQAVIADVHRGAVDGVLIAGDLTKDGHPGEFQIARELLAVLDVPYVAVPGNHDVPNETEDHTTPPIAAFERRFGPGPYPATRRVGAVDVVAVDTASHPEAADRDSPAGSLTAEEREALERELAAARNPIVLAHHNLFTDEEQHGEVRIDDHHEPLAHRGSVHRSLTEHEVPLVLTGHNHWPGVARRDGLTEVAAPAACSLPQSYLLLTIEPGGTTVELVPLADTLALEEAYQYARAGTARSRSIAAALHDGYLSSFPLVDDGQLPTHSAHPGMLRRLLH